MLGVNGWIVGAMNQFKCGAAFESPSAQHSLWKEPRGPRRKQAGMGAADHLWSSQIEKVSTNKTDDLHCTWKIFKNLIFKKYPIIFLKRFFHSAYEVIV